MMGKIRGFFSNIFSKLFRIKKTIKLGFYGPVNAGKSSLANRISKDFTGEEMSSVSKVPHETRTIIQKEKVKIKYDDHEMDFNLIDTPGIATRIDYEDFLKFKMNDEEAKARAKEATQGVIESIKWLDQVDCVLVVLDATQDPYSQVNITIIGNLAARNTPILIVANKVDLKSAKINRIEDAFPQYKVIGISALNGTHMDELYKEIFNLIKK